MSIANDIRNELIETNDNPFNLTVGPIWWAMVLWEKKKNPHYVDFALTIYDKNDYTIGPLMRTEVMNAAKVRLRGAQRGDFTQAVKDMQVFDYLMWMAIYLESDSKRNKSRAARNALESEDHPNPPEYGTLYRYWNDYIRKPGYESVLIEIHNAVNAKYEKLDAEARAAGTYKCVPLGEAEIEKLLEIGEDQDAINAYLNSIVPDDD